ncbi:Nitrogen regulatory protein PII [Syntrophomonas zehnderi OL-4]|uniref:Nitrogen regulatory protein PII n=1 Tax=Syntrophomonas zehnderi OL-4 TaxID=690567 RepID=A0A0E4GBI0_9FIRM|nr:P-II family nitrogen regulator [Syntrophomonas zehnderi]CFX70207.1 Nitrogen regulatory protein PII [Syntrophomonas zehnderi OL-4]
MKEVMAIIRMDMISKTKEALLKADFPALTCLKVMGRGKQKVDFSLVENLINGHEIGSPVLAEAISEGQRLIPKRLLSIVVQDEDVEKLVETIISVNQKGHPGDGKIFVMPVVDTIKVRTEEYGEAAL